MAKIDDTRGALLTTMLNIRGLRRQLAEQERIEEGLFQQMAVLEADERDREKLAADAVQAREKAVTEANQRIADAASTVEKSAPTMPQAPSASVDEPSGHSAES